MKFRALQNTGLCLVVTNILSFVRNLPSPPRVKNFIFFSLAPTPLPGVHLFLGYSRKDFKILMEGRQEVSDRIPNTDQEEEMEVTSTVQQAVSHFTSNNNKVRELVMSFMIIILILMLWQTECTISLSEKVGENFVLAATLDVWNEFRMKKNMSDAMKYSEKVNIEVKVTLNACFYIRL